MSNTERGDYVFKVSDYEDGTFWISTEPRGAGIGSLRGALLGFELRKGTTVREAQDVARYMNEHLGEVVLVR